MTSSAGPGPVLAIESATPAARVVVVDRGGTVLAGGERVAPRHSGVLLPLVQEVMTRAGVSPSQLDAIAVDAGPGSFTGLRVALALAKGLCLATGARLVLVSSLDALALDLASTAAPGRAIVPCLDAGKGEVYAVVCRAAPDGTVARDGEELRVTPDELMNRLAAVAPVASVVLGGTGVARFPDLASAVQLAAPATVDGPSAISVARLGLARLARGEVDDLEKAVPSYGRPPDITKPRPK